MGNWCQKCERSLGLQRGVDVDDVVDLGPDDDEAATRCVREW